MKYKIEIKNLSKRFGKNSLFKKIDLVVETGKPLAITGYNGAGKSTLLQIVAGLQNQSKGKIEYFCDSKKISSEQMMSLLGFASPLLVLYDDLTAKENLEFCKNDGIEYPSELIELFGLEKHMNKMVSKFSSGMKQRLKLISVFMNNYPILFLDEPCSNLDILGKEIVYEQIKKRSKKSLIIIATNEPEEVDLCQEVYSIV